MPVFLCSTSLDFGILSHGQQISGCNGIYQVSHNEFVFGLEKHHMGWHWFVCLLAALKLIQVERSFAEKHYSDLSTKPFFGALVEYIISGPVVAMVWQGKGVVATGRKIIGATNPAQSEPGTIRGDFCIEVSRWGFFSARSSMPEFQNSKLSPSNCDKGQVLIQIYFHTWFVFFVLVLFRNVIHGSDAVESAQKEIALWFPDGVTEWRSSVHPWIYEN